ncbi:hypothetical protein EHM69_06745 [candidate division KSB1 bacterium]|nr:MAG: hypothetical protein EHM69_06745 [candidate division KSB1 bacterium]
MDLRPAEMYRSTISTWIQRCPYCGFCSGDISEAEEVDKTIVNSPSYQSQLNDPRFSELSNSFLCRAMIENSLGNYQAAGWAALRAAWVMDDRQNVASAAQCRLRAIKLFLRDFAARRDSLKEPAKYYVLLIDLHRRTEQFGMAQTLLLEGRLLNLQDNEQQIFDIQNELIAKRDARCYTTLGELRNE